MQIHVWANQTRWDNLTKPVEFRPVVKTDTKKVNIDDKKPIGKVETTVDTKSDPKLDNSTMSSKDVTQPLINGTDSDLGDISISNFSDFGNKTLEKNNITKTEEDTHQYYNSTFFSDPNIAKMYWVDMDNHPNRQVNDLLSQSHRRAAVRLSYLFFTEK